MTRRFLLLMLAWTALLGAARAAGLVHDLQLSLHPRTGELVAHDRVQLPPGHDGRLQLRLGEPLRVDGVTADGRAARFARDGERLRIDVPPGATRLEVRYAGRLAGDRPPHVAEEGGWIPGDFAWYPRAGDDDVLEVTVQTPPGHRAVLTGTLLDERVEADGVRSRFRAYAGEPPSLFVGPYRVDERLHGRLRLRTYFHADAGALAGAYLDDVARHVDRFASTIGSYPYDGFAVVSAPHPVGLGFPGLTYVSRRILPLPFMRARSLPHEVLHVWWGNSVRVAESSGNWAEGLTTFMSDHDLSEPAERQRMRREWLRDYAALPPQDDHPLAAFRGKLHARDQVVGYGKGAFVFHMLRERLGTRVFDDGLARFYAARRGQPGGWSDLRAAFEAASGESLERFFAQWVDRAGAPELSLQDVAFGEAGVRFALAQRGAPYALRVPVVVETSEGRETHVLSLDAASRPFDVATRARPVALHVDPDVDLFRRLAPAETTPILRELILAPQAQAVVLGPGDELASAARAVARRLLDADLRPVAAEAWVRGRPALVVGLGTPQAVATALRVPVPPVPAAAGTAFVWAARVAGAPVVVVAARDVPAVEALAAPLPHHGREGWLL
ncbi:MAG TPA: M1 family aminopeptidase, partial [Albitalea sp.]